MVASVRIITLKEERTHLAAIVEIPRGNRNDKTKAFGRPGIELSLRMGIVFFQPSDTALSRGPS
jgi:hypothetical protein